MPNQATDLMNDTGNRQPPANGDHHASPLHADRRHEGLVELEPAGPTWRCAHIGAPFEEDVIALRRDTTSRKTSEALAALRAACRCSRSRKVAQRYFVWDSLAICETLAERHPEAKLWPDGSEGARAVARAYSAEMHSGFPDVRDQLTMDFARRNCRCRSYARYEGADRAHHLRLWTDALSQYGGKGGFLFGRFSIADCMYAPVVSRFVTYGIALAGPASLYRPRLRAAGDERLGRGRAKGSRRGPCRLRPKFTPR